jgi:RNA polymerase sigma factor (sigma-70 family)
MIEATPTLDGKGPGPSGLADFESFYRANRVRLFRALVVMTRDVHGAEELTQESFVKVWERWERVTTMADPIGYLYRTALNGWFQVHRRAGRAARRVVLSRDVLDPIETVDERDMLARQLLQLPARQRAALVLTEYLGHNSTTAGRVLGIRPGTVRRLASKARATLRQRFEEEEGTR